VGWLVGGWVGGGENKFHVLWTCCDEFKKYGEYNNVIFFAKVLTIFVNFFSFIVTPGFGKFPFFEAQK
jgi:hypothetical protein